MSVTGETTRPLLTTSPLKYEPNTLYYHSRSSSRSHSRSHSRSPQPPFPLPPHTPLMSQATLLGGSLPRASSKKGPNALHYRSRRRPRPRPRPRLSLLTELRVLPAAMGTLKATLLLPRNLSPTHSQSRPVSVALTWDDSGWRPRRRRRFFVVLCRCRF